MQEQSVDSDGRSYSHVVASEQPTPVDATKPPEIHGNFLQMGNHELIAYLQEHFPEVTPEMWLQLNALDQPSIETVLKQQQDLETRGVSRDISPLTHLNYELEMLRLVFAYQELIENFLFDEDETPINLGSFEIHRKDVIQRLVYVILLSDVGKAGNKQLELGETSPILQIYQHVIMDADRHGSWLQGKTEQDFPDELRPALETVKQQNLEQQVFGAGNFALAPVRLALHCAENVFLSTYPGAAEYAHYFQVTPETEAALAEIGMDADTTLMKDFWTNAHLACGDQFFQTEAVTPEYKGLAQLALFHHHSQGADPHPREGIHFEDPRTVRLLALTEFLDKADANCHRSQHTDLDTVTALTERMVMPAISRSRGEDEVAAYNQTLHFLKYYNIFSALLRTART